jgi:hypothetical protein
MARLAGSQRDNAAEQSVLRGNPVEEISAAGNAESISLPVGPFRAVPPDERRSRGEKNHQPGTQADGNRDAAKQNRHLHIRVSQGNSGAESFNPNIRCGAEDIRALEKSGSDHSRLDGPRLCQNALRALRGARNKMLDDLRD